MQIPTLLPHLSPLSMRRELRYTLVRLRTPTWAKPHVVVFEGLLKSCELHFAQDSKLRDALEDAEAELDQVDADLDELALYISKFIKAETSGAVRSDLYHALFGDEAPSKFVRPRLGAELEQVRTWPTLLAGAPLAKLVALSTDVADVIKRCDAALAAHSKASGDLAGFQLNQWAPFIAKVNGERQSLGGEAKKQLRLDGSEGGGGLFRIPKKSRTKDTVTLTLLTDQIRRSESELAELHQQKAELEQELQAEAVAQAKRAKKAAALAELRKTEADIKAQAKALEAELART